MSIPCVMCITKRWRIIDDRQQISCQRDIWPVRAVASCVCVCVCVCDIITYEAMQWLLTTHVDVQSSAHQQIIDIQANTSLLCWFWCQPKLETKSRFCRFSSSFSIRFQSQLIIVCTTVRYFINITIFKRNFFRFYLHKIKTWSETKQRSKSVYVQHVLKTKKQPL